MAETWDNKFDIRLLGGKITAERLVLSGGASTATWYVGSNNVRFVLAFSNNDNIVSYANTDWRTTDGEVALTVTANSTVYLIAIST